MVDSTFRFWWPNIFFLSKRPFKLYHAMSSILCNKDASRSTLFRLQPDCYCDVWVHRRQYGTHDECDPHSASFVSLSSCPSRDGPNQFSENVKANDCLWIDKSLNLLHKASITDLANALPECHIDGNSRWFPRESTNLCDVKARGNSVGLLSAEASMFLFGLDCSTNESSESEDIFFESIRRVRTEEEEESVWCWSISLPIIPSG